MKEKTLNKPYIRRIFRPETRDYLFICGSKKFISKDREALTRNLSFTDTLNFHATFNIKDSVYDPEYGSKLKARKEREKQIISGTYDPFK